MLPADQMWLSLSITIDDRSCRCVDIPPTSSEYFSTSRNPGVVFRVPATSPCHPWSSASCCSRLDIVAMPLALVKQFSATRSPSRMFLT